MHNLKDLVKDNTVNFQFYRDGNLIYKVSGTDFEFPVPISDVGNATFLAEDKAMLFMRYIRKHLDTIAAGNESVDEVSLDNNPFGIRS